MQKTEISRDDLIHWQQHGWVRITGGLPADAARELTDWAAALEQLPNDGDTRLHYFEETANGTSALCRVERFLEDHSGVRDLVSTGAIPAMVGQLMGEPARVYKEKLNTKYPGGAGYAPHQDATAYDYADHHITCLIAIDAMTPDNGCLQFAPLSEWSLLDHDADGCILDAAALDWSPAPLDAGDILMFGSMTPHRSGDNMSDQPRRAIYLTYNAASLGDQRARYYAARDEYLADHRARQPDAEIARISTIGHFQGRPA